MKYCSKCKLEKPATLEYYYKNKCKKDGFNNWCIICLKEFNKIHKKRYHKNYYSKSINKKQHNNYQKKYITSQKIKEHIRNYKQNYRANPEKRRLMNAFSSNYIKERCLADPKFKLACRLRHRLYLAIKNNYKSGSAVKDLGCTISELKEHLENKFQLGMTWDNWTTIGWHIDHIKPLSKFDLTDRQQFLEACHYTNLQPLWAEDNLIKSDKAV